MKVLQVWGEPRLLFSSMSGFFLFIFSLDLSLDLSLLGFGNWRTGILRLCLCTSPIVRNCTRTVSSA